MMVKPVNPSVARLEVGLLEVEPVAAPDVCAWFVILFDYPVGWSGSAGVCGAWFCLLYGEVSSFFGADTDGLFDV